MAVTLFFHDVIKVGNALCDLVNHVKITNIQSAVTVSLPDFIHAVPGGIRSDYKATDGNINLVFAFVPAVRVTGDYNQAIDEALQALTITAPTSSGKREEIPFEIVSVSQLFDAKRL